MKTYSDMTKDELGALIAQLEEEFAECKAKRLHLNMARGKPSAAQLNLSMPMLDCVSSQDALFADDGTDCRNYGVVDGLPEAKALMAQMVGAKPEQVMVFGNSSLNAMFDMVGHAWTKGVCGDAPWCEQGDVKFLCPVPGYDRHFSVTEHFGIEMIPVPMSSDGPNMDMVERIVTSDAKVKGIWCVPMYSNPGGTVYSDDTVRRLAALKPAAPDFRIFWDNAYCVHHLYDEHPSLLNILDEAERSGSPNIVYEFCSTSKVTFPGAGIAALVTSETNREDFMAQMKAQTIGHDKINQLRHVRFLKDAKGIAAHMKKHAEIIRPKFEAVLSSLDTELGGLGIGSWTNPQGGYFISFDALPGCAKAIVKAAGDAGVTMTGAGATWPLHNDPSDSNIRIAPTLPTPEELTEATQVFVLCVKLVSAKKLLDA